MVGKGLKGLFLGAVLSGPKIITENNKVETSNNKTNNLLNVIYYFNILTIA